MSGDPTTIHLDPPWSARRRAAALLVVVALVASEAVALAQVLA